ncbi:hypothetical protein GYMLUDRAFT_102512, partial [Collybiopsis luxurians FD-317 M1]
WLAQYRESYLDSHISFDGRGCIWLSHNGTCTRCKAVEGIYWCTDCTGGAPYCQDCIIKVHLSLPLHTIQKWENNCFKKISLHSLGLRFQLGHLLGQTCSIPEAGHSNFFVIHHNSIHRVAIRYCGCVSAPPLHEQLLEIGWWPATAQEPQTAATIHVLQAFHVLNLCSHLTLTDFYQSLEELTDGTG